MTRFEGEAVDLPIFTFRVTVGELEDYRRALGVRSGRIPLCMALRALTSELVTSVLREAAQGRTLIHVAQEFRSENSLRVGVDYTCSIRLQHLGPDRLRLEQRLDDAGSTCLLLVADIALVKR